MDVLKLPAQLEMYNESAVFFNLSSAFPRVQTFRAYHTSTKAISAVRVSQKLQVNLAMMML